MRKPINIIGRQFGRLVAESDVHGLVTCLCACGTRKVIAKKHLLSGATRSCGCLRGEGHLVIKPGDRYGRLTVIERMPNKGKRTVWRCRCGCGNTADVTTTELRSGDTKSCGCLFDETPKETPQMRAARKEYTDRNYADGTHEALIRKRDKVPTHNTSGVRGVYRLRNGKYQAVINFKKKRYSLGKYDELAIATAMREAAEHLVYDAYLEDGLDIQYKTAADLRDACWRFISLQVK